MLSVTHNDVNRDQSQVSWITAHYLNQSTTTASYSHQDNQHYQLWLILNWTFIFNHKPG